MVQVGLLRQDRRGQGTREVIARIVHALGPFGPVLLLVLTVSG